MILWLRYCRYKIKAIFYLKRHVHELVAQREFRLGPVNNNGGVANEPRLAFKHADYDTPDNSLWGDDGWKEEHSVKLGFDYKSPEGMAAWLIRNPCYGLGWTKLGAPIDQCTAFDVRGNLDIGNQTGITGSLSIQSSNGYWQWKVVGRWPWSKTHGYQVTLGWLLDAYVRNGELWRTEPKAIFQLEPRLVRISRH